MKSFLIVLLAVIAASSAQDVVGHVKACLNQEKGKAQCVADVLGSDIVVAKDKVEALLQSAIPQIKDFLKAKGEQIKYIIEHRQEYFEKAKDKATHLEVVTKVTACMKTEEKTKVQCVADVLGSDLVIAKDKAETLLKTATQQVKDFLKAKEEQIKQIIEHKQDYFDMAKAKAEELKEKASELKEKVKDKATELKDKAQKWFDDHFGSKDDKDSRVKRDIPTQSEINLAQKIKFCMEKNGETTSENCMSKILGTNTENVDTVKLQTIINYEAVLAELKEYFKAKEQGKTLKEFLADQKAKRPKRDAPTQSEINTAQKIKLCMEKNGETTSENCMSKVLGSNAQNYDSVKLQTIINYEAVLAELKEYFKAKEQGKTLKEFLADQKAKKAGY